MYGIGRERETDVRKRDLPAVPKDQDQVGSGPHRARLLLRLGDLLPAHAQLLAAGGLQEPGTLAVRLLHRGHTREGPPRELQDLEPGLVGGHLKANSSRRLKSVAGLVEKLRLQRPARPRPPSAGSPARTRPGSRSPSSPCAGWPPSARARGRFDRRERPGRAPA